MGKVLCFCCSEPATHFHLSKPNASQSRPNCQTQRLRNPHSHCYQQLRPQRHPTARLATALVLTVRNRPDSPQHLPRKVKPSDRSRTHDCAVNAATHQQPFLQIQMTQLSKAEQLWLDQTAETISKNRNISIEAAKLLLAERLRTYMTTGK